MNTDDWERMNLRIDELSRAYEVILQNKESRIRELEVEIDSLRTKMYYDSLPEGD
jgi:hypothetical protein